MSATITQKNPLALMMLQRRLREISKKVVAVGFPKGKAQAYPETGEEVASVAAQHVYGIDVPQRDFMGYAKAELQRKCGPIMRKVAEVTATASPTTTDIRKAEALLAAAGEQGAAVVKNAIIELDDPPNSPATIAKKGSSNPLIDTGHMKDTTTYEVRKR